ncbi:MAG: hypothetical protein WC758_01850 [Candidatus Woesearchaeota archaeon]|jgi:hypothetical protein
MISITIILVLLVFALAFFIFFKVLRGAIKALMAIFFLILFVTLVLGVLIYIDINKIKGSFNDDQIVLLTHKGEVVSGIQFLNSKNTEILQSQKYNLLDYETLTNINDQLKKNTYESNSGEIITIIIDSSYLINTSVMITDSINITLDDKLLDDVFSCTELKDCTRPLKNAAPELKNSLDSSFDDAQDVKNKLFFNIFAQKITESKGIFVINGIKEKKITIYPQLTTLKIINFIPAGFFKKTISGELFTNIIK